MTLLNNILLISKKSHIGILALVGLLTLVPTFLFSESFAITYTGSISLDRTAYPVPFGDVSNFDSINSSIPGISRSIFPIHQTSISDNLDSSETLGVGNLVVHIWVNDPDFNTSDQNVDSISHTVGGTAITGPLKITISRGSDVTTLGYAGGPVIKNVPIDVGDNNPNSDDVRQLGPILEIAPDAGIFEFDLVIPYHDGPASDKCPHTKYFEAFSGESKITELQRFDNASSESENYCILAGDVITVQYTDPADSTGNQNISTDSAQFDLRNGVLQTDKSVYIIGRDVILTLIEPDFDLDNDAAETYDLDLIKWDSDAATLTMGDSGGEMFAFDPEPTVFRETGDSSGIFQVVFRMPEALQNDNLERGEKIVLEYTDWGPSNSDFVGPTSQNINHTIFTSNFGATVELDQKVYSWTDKVYVTIVAPDHDFNPFSIDFIGETDLDPVKISTRGYDIDNFMLVETGISTGIFTGEVTLTGFCFDADGNSSTGDDGNSGCNKGDDTSPKTSPENSGPVGFLETNRDDGITVSFEFSEDETVVGSALIRWNIAEVIWIPPDDPKSNLHLLRIIEPDMNLEPGSLDLIDVHIWSDSDVEGIDISIIETSVASGVFEGNVIFTPTGESMGNQIKVDRDDAVYAEYIDHTLPEPFTLEDNLSLIGSFESLLVGNHLFDISVATNSIIKEKGFNEEQGSYNLVVSGKSGTVGELTASIPKRLMYQIDSVTVNGEEVEFRSVPSKCQGLRDPQNLDQSLKDLCFPSDISEASQNNFVGISYLHSEDEISISGPQPNSVTTKPRGDFLMNYWWRDPPMNISSDEIWLLTIAMYNKNEPEPILGSVTYIVDILADNDQNVLTIQENMRVGEKTTSIDRTKFNIRDPSSVLEYTGNLKIEKANDSPTKEQANIVIPVQGLVEPDPGDLFEPPEINSVIKTTGKDSNEKMKIELTLTDSDGNAIEYIKYKIKAKQGSTVILDKEDHMQDGKLTNTHYTDPLPFAASDKDPVFITIESMKFGHDEEFVVYSEEIGKKKVVPEFGSISLMILAASIISTVIISLKSNLKMIRN